MLVLHVLAAYNQSFLSLHIGVHPAKERSYMFSLIQSTVIAYLHNYMYWHTIYMCLDFM